MVKRILFLLLFWSALPGLGPVSADPAMTIREIGSGQYASLAVVNGNPAISYHSVPDGSLQYIRGGDASGDAWNMAVVVDNSGIVGQYTSLAVVNGNPAISYYDADNGFLMYVRAQDENGMAWDVPVVVDNSADVGYDTSLEVVNGNPAVSYYDNTNATLKYVRAQDPDGVVWGGPVAADNTQGVGRYASLSVVDGNPAISYYDALSEALNFVRALDINGDAWGAPVQLDADGDVGHDTSLDVVNGNPAVSYYDVTNGDLKYVRSSNADGSAWNLPVRVDDSDDAGQYSSLEIIMGHPAISYFDFSGGVLKYVRANDTDGGDWPAPLAADASPGVGYNPSLARVNGAPAISYFDFENGVLKYTRALDSTGTVWPDPVADPETGSGTGGTQDGGTGMAWDNCRKDIVVATDEFISGGCVSGTITNYGIIEDVEVVAGTVVTGGQISGDIDNAGTLKDVSITWGSMVTGGYLSGIILNSGALNFLQITPGSLVTGGGLESVEIGAGAQVTGGSLSGDVSSSGTISDTSLGPCTKILGGKFTGSVSGDPQDPATIIGEVEKGAVLSNLVIGEGCIVSPKCSLGTGVRFAANTAIPSGTDLMPMMCKTGGNTGFINMAETIDLTCDVLWPEDHSILDDLNVMDFFTAGNMVLTQDSITGTVHVQGQGNRMSLRPVSLSQRKDLAEGVTVSDDGTFEIITGSRRRLELKPMIDQAWDFADLMKSLGYTATPSYDGGVIRISTGVLSEYIMQPDPYAAPQSITQPPAGLPSIQSSASGLLPNVYLVSMAFMFNGVQWEQKIYPAPLDATELRTDLKKMYGAATAVVCRYDGTVEIDIGYGVYSGLLGYGVQQNYNQQPQLQLLPAGDRNGDGVGDIKLIYTSGYEQILYLLP